ncbi:MAG: hypothetical protein HOV80_37810 [Polyangiaceae bacterium]|nr:hypothetical protein [Polyangiaceae bacterium]
MPLIAAALAVLLSLPTLTMGPMLDDLLMGYIVRGQGVVPGGPRGIWDLYRFADGGPGVDEATAIGMYPWWSSSDLKLAFFRPLSSLWVAVDQSVFAGSPWVWHAGSIALYAGLILVVAKLYGRFIGGAAAGLATLFYAIDDAHLLPVLWSANRHALVSAFFGFAALYMHSRRRSLVGAGLFAVALAGGEAAIGLLPYFLAFAWFVDDRGRRAGLRSLVPYGIVMFAWIGLYLGLGYGASGSAFYIHPTASPGRFPLAVLERAPQLVLGQLFGPPAELWGMLPTGARLPAGVIVFLVASGLTAILLRGAWGHPSTKFFALGALGSLVPLCATLASDRNLMFPGFGAFGLLAIGVGRVATAVLERKSTRLATGVAAFALFIHLIVAPLLFVVRGEQARGQFETSIARGAGSMPNDEAVKNQLAMVLVTPDPLMTQYMFLRRIVDGHGFAGGRVLSAAQKGPLTIERTSARGLSITAKGGRMCDDLFSSVYRDKPYEKGAVRRTGDVTVTVLELDAEGYPSAVSFEFDEPIDGDKRRWLAWQGAGFKEVSLPGPGSSMELEVTDWMTAFGQ